MISAPDQLRRPFVFERDTFAFANGLVWRYRFDPVTGAMTTFYSNPPPPFTHRCFTMVRTVRQFFYHARFDPELPAVEEQTYRALIREVVSRSPRKPGLERERIVIPGYDCLRSFSRAREPLLKEGCGGRWASYFVRSHWRMVAPTTRRHQEQMAQQLRDALCERPAPAVHLYRFPRVTINHGILLFASTESDRGFEFDAYDPNLPELPVKLAYDRAARSFFYPRAQYWPGGPLNVYEMYIKGLY